MGKSESQEYIIEQQSINNFGTNYLLNLSVPYNFTHLIELSVCAW
jgi:hypothetical protein